jgi:uncharacterized membrane protein
MTWGLTPIHPVIVLVSIIAVFAIPIAIIWLLVLLVRNSSEARSGRQDPAVEQLRVRFARGDISQAEFEEAMRALGYERRT